MIRINMSKVNETPELRIFLEKYRHNNRIAIGSLITVTRYRKFVASRENAAIR